MNNFFQRVAVHGLVKRDDGKILVMHRMVSNDWKPDEWDIPGGSVEMGELDIESALKRELMEEANIEVEVIRPIDVYSSMSSSERHQFQITYLCRYVSGDIKYEVDDHDEHRWIDFDELSKLNKKIAFLDQLSHKITSV